MEKFRRELNPSVKQGVKVGLGVLLVLVILGSGLILQTSYARTLDQLQFDFIRYPLSETQPDPYRILINPQVQTGAEGVEDTLQRTVTVSGSGQASAQPDQARVRLGVQTEAETAEQAMAENSNQMQALLATLEEKGIPAADIQTQALQLQPRYNNPPEAESQQQPQVTGYTAVNMVEVQVRELEGLGELLDATVQAGGNMIQGVQFELSDQAGVLDQARQAAVAEAQHKAEQLTSLLGTELGEVFTIDETSQMPGPIVRELAFAESSAVPVEPGTQTVQVEVQVTWLLR